MPQTLAVASMVRNEATNYLPSALDAWSQFSDHIIILDDGSTDGTGDLCRDAGCDVIPWTGKTAWGAEDAPRRALWQAAVNSKHDWIFVLDADMVPAKDPRDLLMGGIDGVAFALYDLWAHGSQGLLYRTDHYWKGHKVPRLWLVRNPRTTATDQWSGRGIHSGHFPQNLRLDRIISAPQEYSLLHYAYLTEGDRFKKSRQYMSQGHRLTMHEWVHAASITDPAPNLKLLDIDITWPLFKEKSHEKKELSEILDEWSSDSIPPQEKV